MFKNKKFSKFKIVFATIIGTLIIGRIFLPAIILKQLNIYLANFSPVYKLHIGDLDIALFRAAYRLEKIEGEIKKDGEKFVDIGVVDISLAWRELFKRRIVTDIVIYDGNILLTKALFESREYKNKDEQKKTILEAKNVKDTLFPLRVEQVLIHDSTIQFADTIRLPLTERLVADNIEGSIINLTPYGERPETVISAKGTILGMSELKIAGTLRTLNQPMDWDVDTQIRRYDLTTANKYIVRAFPLTFKRGMVDIYVEAKSENGKIVGYAKPFFEDLDVIGDNRDFKGIKHFFIEIATAIANAILKDRKTKTLAAKITFSNESGEMKINPISEILKKAWKHGAGEPLKPAIDNSIQLSKERKNN